MLLYVIPMDIKKQKRLFIGFSISDDDGRALIAHVKNSNPALSPSIKWTIDGNFHVTSHFLGETDEAAIPAICEAMDNLVVDQKSTAIEVTKLANFPQGKARLLAAYIAPNTLLTSIHQQLVSSHQQQAYLPHITLARGLAKTDKVQIEVTSYNLSLTHLLLYESFVIPTGAPYKIVHKTALF
ncbi:MAG: RNA 2',3'-cyclic phosphodiesterase [Coxiella sp. (in: Bacteria)]|nr:MAG: RNA 2',3'-cyclic phosphodiesterase [Coxiella sp. (in: g-proteobacteria)]